MGTLQGLLEPGTYNVGDTKMFLAHVRHALEIITCKEDSLVGYVLGKSTIINICVHSLNN